MDRVSVPEVQVIVITNVPAVAEEVAVIVIGSGEVIGPEIGRVTPGGKPDTEQVTLPVNPFRSVTVIVLVAAPPGATETAAGEAETVKLGVGATVSAMVVDPLSVPEVPAIVMVVVAAAAELLAAKVSTLLPVAGLVPNVAVTPVGNPDAARVTLPLNGLTSVTVMASVPLPP